MTKVRDDVRDAVLSFVRKGQSFNSLDIYSMLGVRINDNEYPIYQQVWDLFKDREMLSYLAEYVTIDLECGGYAKVWRYYKPKADVKKFKVAITSDGRLEIPKEAMGHFPLVVSEMGLDFSDGLITLKKHKDHQFSIALGDRTRIPSKYVKMAMLDTYNSVEVHTYLNRIEIVGINDI